MSVSATPDRPRASESTATYPSRVLAIRLQIAYLLALVGFIGLLTGLDELLSGKLLVALVLAAAIQTLSVVAIRDVKTELARQESVRWKRVLIGMALYGAAVYLTASFSYSTFHRWLQADASARQVAAMASRTIASRVDDLEASFRGLQSVFDELALRSAELRKEESDRGNSCEGLPSPRGDGPVWRYRGKEAIDFRGQRDALEREVSRIREITDEIRRKPLVVGQVALLRRDLEIATSKANALLQHPILGSLLTFVIKKQEAGAKVDAQRQCADDSREAQLAAAKLAVERIQKLKPLEAPILFDPADRHSLTKRAFVFLMAAGYELAHGNLAEILNIESISGMPRETKLGSLDRLLPDDMWPLLLVLILEALLFLLLTPKSRDVERTVLMTELRTGARRLRTGSSAVYALYLLLTVPDREAVQRVHDTLGFTFGRHYGALGKYLVPGGRSIWIVLLPNTRQHRHAATLLHGLARHGDAALIRSCVAVNALPDDLRIAGEMWADSDASPNDPEGSVQIWRVSRRFADWTRMEEIRKQYASGPAPSAKA